MPVTLQPTTIVDTAARLYGADLDSASKRPDTDAVVARVAQELHAQQPDELAAIREALVAHWADVNAQRGGAAQTALGAPPATTPTTSTGQSQPTTGAGSALDTRSPGVPGAVLNAVVPLLDKGALTDAQLTAGLAQIHNAWYAQAHKDGYLLGERDKQHPVMKMARSFFVQVEANGGQLTLKLNDSERAFVRAYGKKQAAPDAALSDDAALALGTQKILAEIRANNADALQESLKLVTAHLAGDVARIGIGDYLDKVRAMPDIQVPAPKASLSAPSMSKAMETVERRLVELDKFIAFLDTKGDEAVRRADVPKPLLAAFDLFEEQHNRWTKQQLSWGSTSNPDFVRTDELSGKRLALDAAPLRGAYQTLLAGLAAGTVTPAALNAILPLLEKGRLTPEQLTAGLSLIHNDWYSKAKADGYLLGVRDKSDPVMKMARSFFVQVEAKGGELRLLLDAKEQEFVRFYGRLQAGDQKTLSDSEALEAGTAKIVAEIRANNQGALDEGMKLVTAHLGGNIVRTAMDGYLDGVKAMPSVALPTPPASSAAPTDDARGVQQARDAAAMMLRHVDELIELFQARGKEPAPRESVPYHLRAAWDLFAEEHDRWLAQQIAWGNPPSADWVHSSQLPANRIILDAAVLRGALLTIQGAL